MTDHGTKNEELSEMITDAVAKGFRKAGRKKNAFITILAVLIAAGVAFCAYRIYESTSFNNSEIASVEGHDLTLENHGIFGYTAADFDEVIIGTSTRQKQLIVDEQEVSVPTTITQAGTFNWAIFSQSRNETIFGTGTYTIDLSSISSDDIDFDEDNLTITITIPYPELHSVSFDPSKTVIGDTQKGWLAFGDISLNDEQRKAFETQSIAKLTERLKESDCFDRAVKYAELSAREVYQPVVSAVSPAYTVEIQVADSPDAYIASSATPES